MYLVFGATGGIGSELVRRLSQQAGARVVLAGRDGAKLESLSQLGSGTVVVDPLDPDQVGGLFPAGATFAPRRYWELSPTRWETTAGERPAAGGCSKHYLR